MPSPHRPIPSGRVLTWLVCFLTLQPASRGRIVEAATGEGIAPDDLDVAADTLGIERFEEGGVEHWQLANS